MRFTGTLLGLGVVLLAAHSSSAQSFDPSAPLAPQRQLSLDVTLVGLNVGYATRQSANTSFGVSLGVGGDWIDYMALGGSHFAEPSGLSYQAKDGRTGKELIEIARAGIFVRRHFASGRQLDVGLKGSGFLHFDSSDDEPGGGAFVGLDVTGTWLRWNRFRLGSEIDVGRYAEASRAEFGVNVLPLLLRVTF